MLREETELTSDPSLSSEILHSKWFKGDTAAILDQGKGIEKKEQTAIVKTREGARGRRPALAFAPLFDCCLRISKTHIQVSLSALQIHTAP
jgi:hypothetical protein